MRKSVRRGLWLLASAAILGLVVYNFRKSPEWRHFNWRELIATALHANSGWLFLGLFSVFVSHLVRALRWKLLMRRIKKGSLLTLFKGQILGFSAIYLVGRTGEVVRPTYIAKKEEVHVSSMMAVWLIERIFDQIGLVLLFSLATMMLPLAAMARHTTVLVTLRHTGDILLGVVVVMVVLVVIFLWQPEWCTSVALSAMKFLPARFRASARRFLESFSDGLGAVQGVQGFSGVVVLTGILWGVNASTFWLVMKSLGGTLGALPWLAAAVVMFCASLGLIVQFPGIGGGYQVATILALTEVFSIDAPVATGLALLVWVLVFLPVLLLGLVILIHEGFSLRRLEAIAEAERAPVHAE